MNFKIIPKNEFYRVLYEDHKFCEELGKVMLAASMLESNLKTYLKGRNVQKVNKKAALGRLVLLMKQHNILSKNGRMHFEELILKRNYLAHNLYDLFCNDLEETILPSENLVEMDIDIFREKANVLVQDLIYFSEIVTNASSDTEILL